MHLIRVSIRCVDGLHACGYSIAAVVTEDMDQPLITIFTATTTVHRRDIIKRIAQCLYQHLEFLWHQMDAALVTSFDFKAHTTSKERIIEAVSAWNRYIWRRKWACFCPK